jgi:hypothetical protein
VRGVVWGFSCGDGSGGCGEPVAMGAIGEDFLPRIARINTNKKRVEK